MFESSKHLTTWHIASTSLICDKNLFPKPSPLLAPFTSPAISVNEKLVLVAKYAAETATANKDEAALLQASLENAEKTNLNATIEAGQKVSEQQKALAKDSRTAEEIVNEVMENGKAEIGNEVNKDNVER